MPGCHVIDKRLKTRKLISRAFGREERKPKFTRVPTQSQPWEQIARIAFTVAFQNTTFGSTFGRRIWGCCFWQLGRAKLGEQWKDVEISAGRYNIYTYISSYDSTTRFVLWYCEEFSSKLVSSLSRDLCFECNQVILKTQHWIHCTLSNAQ